MNCRTIITAMSAILLVSCAEKNDMKFKVFETSASGKNIEEVNNFNQTENHSKISVNLAVERQAIIGFGGAFTESSAYNLNKLSAENRDAVLKAYFSQEGSNYSLTRTHMNSCDFSVSNYSYTPVPSDIHLEHFSVDEDRDDLIPMIKDAQAISQGGFKILASPWSAAPWMKDNNDWCR